MDLGTDVKPARFVEAVRDEKPDVVMMSALLTTTMTAMKETVRPCRRRGPEGHGEGGRWGAPR